MQTDEQLMLEFQGGSNRAFEELFSRYRNSIYGFFRRRLNDAGRAEELAQETFVVIIRGAEKYEPTAKFRTYLYSIALKQLWSERRKGSREAKAVAETFEESHGTDPTKGLWIRDALSRMDTDHREVLMLREYEQLAYEDIAAVLAIPINTVRSRLSRARTELRSLLDEQSVKRGFTMSQTQHPQWEQELMPYADDQLDAEHASRIGAHLEGCSECAQAVAAAKGLSLQMASWQVEEAPEKLNDPVLVALEGRTRSRGARTASGWWTRGRVLAYSFGGAFAVLLLVVFAGTPSLLRSRQAALERPFDSSLKVKEALPSAAAQVPGTLGSLQGQEGNFERGESLSFSKSSAPPPDSTGPMVIRTIQLTLITKEFDTARARIEAIVRNSKGYVDQLIVQTNPGLPKGLTASLRFPSDRLDASVIELRKLGIVKQESQNSSDVTSQYVDLVARITNARNTEQRMATIIRERTGNIKDVVEAERELSRVRGEIEQMEAEQKNLNNKVQYATVRVEIAEEYRAEVVPSAPSAGSRLRNAAVKGYQGAIETILLIALTALAYGPTLLVFAVIVLPIAFVAWKNRRRLSY